LFELVGEGNKNITPTFQLLSLCKHTHRLYYVGPETNRKWETHLHSFQQSHPLYGFYSLYLVSFFGTTIEIKKFRFQFQILQYLLLTIILFISFHVNSFKSSAEAIMSIILESGVFYYKEYNYLGFLQRSLVGVWRYFTRSPTFSLG
jgi:hypothetical protein